MLPLFAEALALVEPARRWGISFTTHAITTTGFLWMVALDGSPEAQIARAQNRIPVIDTTRPCTTPEAGTYAQAARGLADVPWKSRTIPAGSPPLSKPSTAVVPTPGQSSALSATFKATPSPSVPLLRSAPPGLVLPPSRGSTAPIRQSGPSGVAPPPVVAGKSQNIWPIVAVIIVLLLLLGGGGLLVYKNYPTIKKTVVALVYTQKEPPPNPTPPTPTPPNPTPPNPTPPTPPPPNPPPTTPPPTTPPPTDKAAADTAAADAAAKAAAAAAANVTPVIASLEILLPPGDKLPAKIQATFTPVQNQTDKDFQKWIENEAKLKIAGFVEPPFPLLDPPPLDGKPENNTLIFTIPSELTPDRFTGAVKGTITLKNPTNQNPHDTNQLPISFGTQDSIDTFHTDQLATKTELGVKNVAPLSNDKSCELLTFHPNANDIKLLLLNPKPSRPTDLSNAISLRQEDGKEKWSVKDNNSLEKENVFEIDRSNPWSPKLKFNPGTSQNLGQLPSCKLAVLSGPKESTKCIAVLQLLQPQGGEIGFEKAGNTLVWKPIDTTSFPSNAVTQYTQKGEKTITITPDNNKKDIVFASTKSFDKPENNPLANITYKCPAKGGKLTPQGDKFLDDKGLVYFLYKINKAFNTPPALARAKTLDDMRKGLSDLKTEFEISVKHWEKVETDNAAPEKAKEKEEAHRRKEFFSSAISAVESQLENLDDVEKTIAAHHAFIAELEKATFEASVSWVVEPSEADKGSFEKLTEPLTEDEKTVRAVVPASK